ncbi:PilN family type IVB pilus formation outer membrane protein [Salmonella enterica subsp. enterica serovar Abony]|nr:PilN family type IVB pilus formation outer membrane protein [Salmonella enterica]EAA4188426.1 PilN family type IVB pilus formation outer membrane protein [Salmonella enterica subsp. enterica serovar Mikawasima]EAB7505467.1 PilN family type IVB pilus formation outer membrane protein [Salmonella enterica subsp. enterica]EAC0381160.1 PilN family type IVB pilus formation outer membrane protein [Salmonella enterica subsp. enterica serovar Potsdam]EBQ9894308.1 PilN family type IVB pilus formation 
MNATENHIDRDRELLSSQVDNLRHTQSNKSSLVKIHKTGFWVDKKNVPLKKDAAFINCPIMLNEASLLSINELGRKIESICHIPVVMNNTVTSEKNENGDNDRTEVSPSPYVSVNWTGPLKGLLDDVSARTGYSWRLDDGRIVFFYRDTRTFQIYALPGTDTVNLGLKSSGTGKNSGSGNSGSGSSGSDDDSETKISVSSELTSEVLRDIENTVKAMLSPSGKMSLSPSTAALTVTDTAPVLNQVARFIEEQNKLLTTQVLLNVKVFSIDFSRQDQYSIDWKAIVNGSKGTISWVTTPGLSTPVNGTVNVLRGDLDASAFIRALSSQGKVSVLTQPSITTLNLQAAPMEVVTERSYVASVSSSMVADVGTESTITPGTVNTGFTMGLLPYVMGNNQLLLQYSINISDLKQLTEFSTGTGNNQSTVQLPEVNRRAFNQKVKINSGETLILSGFEQGHLSSDMQGTGSPRSQWLGGSRSSDNLHSVLIIMITPMVIS